MIPIEQSRIGERGTCFRACLASLLNLREDQVPDFPDANQDSGVDKFLRRFGLHYNERPIDRGDPPRGWHVILGESPRGGEHAVVGYNGIFRHDPHPIWDDRRRGLVDEKAWGELLPLKREAKDSKKEAEALRARHDEIVSSHLRGVGNSAETAYRSLHQLMIGLLHDAEALLAKTRLDDDQAYWRDKISDAKRHLAESERCASIRNWSLATSYLDAALTMAHTVIDKLRNTGGGRKARDMAGSWSEDRLKRLRAQYNFEKKAWPSKVPEVPEVPADCELVKGVLQWKGGKKPVVHSGYYGLPPKQAADSSNRRARLHRALDRVLDSRAGAKDATIQNATAAQLRARLEKIKGAQPETAALERLLRQAKGKDMADFRKGDRVLLRSENALGTVTEVIAPTNKPNNYLPKIRVKFDAGGESVFLANSSTLSSAKDAFEGGPGTTNSASNTWYDVRPNEREAILVGTGISAGQARNWSGEGWMKLPSHVQAAWVAARVSKAKDASPRRARLHAALDRVLDSHEKRRVRDAEKYPQPGWRA